MKFRPIDTAGMSWSGICDPEPSSSSIICTHLPQYKTQNSRGSSYSWIWWTMGNGDVLAAEKQFKIKTVSIQFLHDWPDTGFDSKLQHTGHQNYISKFAHIQIHTMYAL